MTDYKADFNVQPLVVNDKLVLEAIEELGYRFIAETGSELAIATLHWPYHTLQLEFSDDQFRMLYAEVSFTGSSSLSRINEISHAVDAWNSERVSPAAYLSIADDARINVFFRTGLAIARRASLDQIKAFIRVAAESTVVACETFVEQFPELGQRSGQASNSFGDLDFSLTDDSQLPTELSIPRVRSVLRDLGIEKTHGDDAMVLAWINDILVGFFLESGPSLLVKGHWDPGLDPDREYMKAALVCNKWNEDNPTTKAFCVTDEDGLQVRVEFVADSGAGLNTSQLILNVQMAIHFILSAIDRISTEIQGHCAVAWPEDTN